MFHYEYEKRPASASSCASRATTTTEYSRSCPSRADYSRTRAMTSVERARRPLPPTPSAIRLPNKTMVPLKVWIIASASCFAVCAALVLATVVVTRWGYSAQVYETPEPVYAQPILQPRKLPPPPIIEPEPTTTDSSEELENDIQFPILEKLSIFKNIVAKRDKKKDFSLLAKPQMHPVHDTTHHAERKIEKKDHAKMPEPTAAAVTENNVIPDFKPTLPDVFINKQNIKLPDGYVAVLKKNDQDFYEEYYNDENLYDDYMQSNTMTSYLIEKVQELHDWIVTDPDFEVAGNHSKRIKSGNEFGQLLKALNDSLIEGNVSIVMNKLKDIYFGDNYTSANHNRKIILSNSTDLLSFGILTLDVMLLHNIQLMAWENQEGVRNKMLKDPDVFAFNALFLDPGKVESKQNEVYNTAAFSKRQNLRQENIDDFDIGKNLLENVLEIGMSTARAAIHLGRAYKNTKTVLSQLSNREALNANIQQQLSRDIDGNTHALNHLTSQQATLPGTQGYTELDCVWLLYCKNLAATAKLNGPLATMARINGIALRMLTGELPADKALDTMVYEALTGWTELRCAHMFPRAGEHEWTVVIETPNNCKDFGTTHAQTMVDLLRFSLDRIHGVVSDMLSNVELLGDSVDITKQD